MTILFLHAHLHAKPAPCVDFQSSCSVWSLVVHKKDWCICWYRLPGLHPMNGLVTMMQFFEEFAQKCMEGFSHFIFLGYSWQHSYWVLHCFSIFWTISDIVFKGEKHLISCQLVTFVWILNKSRKPDPFCYASTDCVLYTESDQHCKMKGFGLQD